MTGGHAGARRDNSIVKLRRIHDGTTGRWRERTRSLPAGARRLTARRDCERITPGCSKNPGTRLVEPRARKGEYSGGIED